MEDSIDVPTTDEHRWPQLRDVPGVLTSAPLGADGASPLLRIVLLAPERFTPLAAELRADRRVAQALLFPTTHEALDELAQASAIVVTTEADQDGRAFRVDDDVRRLVAGCPVVLLQSGSGSTATGGMAAHLSDLVTQIVASADLTAAARRIADHLAPTGTSSLAPQDLRWTGAAAPDAGLQFRLVFSVDVIGYSRRTAPRKNDVQSRIADLAQRVLADAGIDFDDTDHQGTGDGLNLALPAGRPIENALPRVVASWYSRIALDNERFRDRIRIRLAIGVGLFARGAIGFEGETIIEVARLVDCAPLRQAALAHPAEDVVLILSDRLYRDVVRPGYPGLVAERFRPHQVELKEYQETAWLHEPWQAGGR